jgi:hypothetical protein
VGRGQQRGGQRQGEEGDGLSYALRDPAAAAFLGGICERAERDRLGLLLPGMAPEQRDTNGSGTRDPTRSPAGCGRAGRAPSA